MDKYNIEEIILGMADIVRENRILRKEIQRLQKVEDEFHQSIFDRCRASEEKSQDMLKAALAGLVAGKDEVVLAKELVGYL